MQSNRATLIIVTLLLLVPLASVTQADHQPETPVLEQVEDLGSGWAAWSFETNGPQPGGELRVKDHTRPQQVGLALYDEVGELVTWSTLQTFGGDGVRIDGEAAGFEVHHDAYEDTPVPYDGVHFGFPDREAGAYQLVLWWAGQGTWNYTLQGADGVELVAATGGENAFVYDGKAFEDAAVNAQAWDQHRGLQVVADGEVSVEIEGTLLLAWTTRIAGPTLMTLEGPGVQESCSCRKMDATGPDALGPGTYTLSLTTAGNGDTIAGGADVVLPGFPG